MKFKITYLLMILVMVFIFGTGDVCAVAKSSEGPTVFLTETTYDFGVVHEGDEVRYHFVVKNTGGMPLHIIDVKTD